MKISQLSRTTGVSARSIRHYENKRLIAAKRLDNDYREFDDSAVERIRTIQIYLRFGLTTDEIEQVLNCREEKGPSETSGYCDEMLDMYEEKLDKVSRQMDELAVQRRRLEKVIGILKMRRDRMAMKARP